MRRRADAEHHIRVLRALSMRVTVPDQRQLTRFTKSENSLMSIGDQHAREGWYQDIMSEYYALDISSFLTYRPKEVLC